jgi:hypothetical protein
VRDSRRIDGLNPGQHCLHHLGPLVSGQIMRNPTTKQVLNGINKLERYLNDLTILPAYHYNRTAVILALLSKALTVARAICVLNEAGFPAEAFAMSRTLIEIYFCLRYICNKDTEERATTYVKYHARIRQEWQTIIMKYFPHHPPSSIALDEDVLEEARAFKNKAHWTGHGGQAKLMAMEEDTVEFDEQGQPQKSEFDYDAIYFWTSHFVHVTVDALDEHASDRGKVFRVRSHKNEGKRHGVNALFNTLVFLSKSFIVSLRVMHEEQPEILQEIHKLMEKFALKNGS